MSNQALPYTLYTCEQTRKLDQLAIEEAGIPGIVLMKRAGRFAFDTLLQGWAQTKKLIIVCGAGNNAGDGYVVAALAAQKSLAVQVFYLSPPEKLQGDAKAAWAYAEQEKVNIAPWTLQDFKTSITEESLIVDAILGSGLSRTVEGDYAEAIEAINDCGSEILALDVPSGLDGDTGKVWGKAVKATKTCCFIGLKRGLLTGRGPAFVADLRYSTLDVPASCFAEVQATCQRISSRALKSQLPMREADAHKGKFGHVMVVGGDIGMGGAAILAGEASAHSGAGLTSIATQPEHVSGILARCPELMVTGVPSGQALEPLLSKPDVIVLGPGLGRASWSEQMLQQTTLTALPLVMDADALNILAEGRVVRENRRDNWVLTPHPGEAARLLGCSTRDVQEDRFHAAWELQKRYGGVIVLKGAGTLIVSEQGCMLANVGNPGMATGGMGDILSGVIGALIAQGMSLHAAAALAVCVHGDAADCCAEDLGTRGLLASELLPHIRKLLN